jgi:hypothetical protein
MAVWSENPNSLFLAEVPQRTSTLIKVLQFAWAEIFQRLGNNSAFTSKCHIKKEHHRFKVTEWRLYLCPLIIHS